MVSYQACEQNIASEEVGAEAVAAHLVEDLGSQVGVAALDVGSNGGVEEGLGGSRGGPAGALEEEAVELMLAI